MTRTAAWVLLLLAAAPVARAAEHVVLGKKLLIADPTGDPVRRRVVGLGKEGPGSADLVVGDPSITGATVTIFAAGATPSEQTLTLPVVGWRPVSGGFTYSNRTTGGPVRKVVLKRT